MTRWIFVGLSLSVVLVWSVIGLAAAEPDPVGSVGRQIENFTLADHLGKERSLADLADKQLVVVAFLGTECPLAKSYGQRLSKLAGEFAERGVGFVGIDSNAHDSLTELAAFVRQHDTKFPMLKDHRQQVADRFGAQRTPEVFLLDAQRKVRYQGRVDDQWAIGVQRDKPQHEELRAAIDDLLAGRDVAEPRTEVSGCLIGRDRTPKSDSPITYSNQIAAIFNRRCVECHRPGEIAPFPLTDYEQAAGWAETIDEAVTAGRMPPWHADPKHGKFTGERRLSDEERTLIHQWVVAGAPPGNLSELPPLPAPAVAGWQLRREPDAVIEMSTQPFAVPAEGTVRYQFFRVDPQFTEDKWIEAAEVIPGNRAVVHHVLVFARGKQLGSELEDGGARGFLVGYVPGLRVSPFPQGFAKRVTAGSQLIFQVHYTPNGSPQTDITKVGFVFADPDKVTHEVRTVSAMTRRLAIPPGDDNFLVEARSATSPVELQLLGLMPHMHVRGKSFRYEAVFADGSREVLLDVPHFDFNWQTSYRLSEPRTLPKGTMMHCKAHYDNSVGNPNNPDPTRTVRWGDQTWDEMMIGYFDVATSRAGK